MEEIRKQRPSPRTLAARLPEWGILEKLIAEAPNEARVIEIGKSQDNFQELPIIAIEFGSQSPTAPTLLFVGGAHGLERIGSQVVLSQLQSFIDQCHWDELIKVALETIRVTYIPMLNPLGLMNKTRANPNGVDLMRNSPVESDGEDRNFLLGGHRLSKHLPWFRGYGFLEPESQALYDYAVKNIFSSPRVIAIDFHSGFGVDDRIWFPYAFSRKPFPDLAYAYSFKHYFEKTHPNHFYVIEPQSRQYTMSGDLWDHLYLEYRRQNTGLFLPFCLEMGSWLWVRKNPWQLFTLLGPFNPVLPHRLKRILRRHNTLFDFMLKSTVSKGGWTQINNEQKKQFQDDAMELWYK